jgi:hypothetical protein
VAALQGELAATLQQFDGITDVTRVGASAPPPWQWLRWRLALAGT